MKIQFRKILVPLYFFVIASNCYTAIAAGPLTDGPAHVESCKPTSSLTTVKICPDGLPYIWNGQVINEADVRTAHFTNAAGCDSTAVLNLIVLSPSHLDTSIAVCNKIKWNGVVCTTSGNYTTHLTNAVGCDSTIKLHLTVLGSSFFENVTACNSYHWHGRTYTSSGSYKFITTNSAGCDSVITLNLVINSIETNYSKTDAKCNNSATGIITVTPLTGTPPFSYSIGTTGALNSSNVFKNLNAGSYRITVKDSVGCLGYSDRIMIEEPAPINYTIAKSDAACNGTYTGGIRVRAFGGVLPYSFKLGTGGTFTPRDTFTNLRAGDNYRVFIKDANECAVMTDTIAIKQPLPILASALVTDASCFGGASGTIKVFTQDGVPPYKYRLGLSGSFGDNNFFNNLRASKYVVYVADKNNCMVDLQATVSQGPELKVTAEKKDAVCPDVKDGLIKIAASGGSGNYFYKLGTAGSYQQNNAFENIRAGRYFVYVKDSITGCVAAPASVDVSTIHGSCDDLFDATLLENPCSDGFKINVTAESNQPVLISVLNTTGDIVYQLKTTLRPQYCVGQSLPTGGYYISVLQGRNKKVLKAFKLKNGS